MSESFYLRHAADAAFSQTYRAYQRRWATELRESDRVLIELVAERVGDGAGRRLLDVGCSTGNLLGHLRGALPLLGLEGGDLMEGVLDECRSNPTLEGITFRRLDLLELEAAPLYDAVVLNAVLYVLDDALAQRGLERIAGALAPGGSLLLFDLFHAFDQDLVVTERSPLHPEGHILHLRAQRQVEEMLGQAGFASVEFRPFELPIDLAPDPSHETRTRTVLTADGSRLLFRGALAQPWCHAVATVPA